MGKVLPKSALGRRKIKSAPFRQHSEKPDIQALEAENARLRELVTALSEIVMKNIVDNPEPAARSGQPPTTRRSDHR